jgi:chemotaxis protein MotB
MTRRLRRHEEHINHDAWAIPYADLLTLLLAFFVVMYAISSVNAGKYRVLSDSLFAAFRGTPRTMEPIQLGHKQSGSGSDLETTIAQKTALEGEPYSTTLTTIPGNSGTLKPALDSHTVSRLPPKAAAAAAALSRVADEVEHAMDELVNQKLVVVRRTDFWIEVEIRADILFPSGSAHLAPSAVDVIERLAGALAAFPNPIRVEGHTDNKPIRTVAFYSNWELSAARAGSVVRVLQGHGVGPERLAVIGYGDQRPLQSNDSDQGRNANRRVVVVILSTQLARHNDPTESPADPATPSPSNGAPSDITSAGASPGQTTALQSAAGSIQPASPGDAPAPSSAPPQAGAPLASPGEPAQMPVPLTPSAAPPRARPAAQSAMSLSTAGAHVAGNGMVPAP